jgi:pyruvate formate lyase activating enzyme
VKFQNLRVTKGCIDCRFCQLMVDCPVGYFADWPMQGSECTGWGICTSGCPAEALAMEEVEEVRTPVNVFVDDRAFQVPSGITVLTALEMLGYKVSQFYGDGVVNQMCTSGACYNCCVLIDGQLKRSCVTPVEEGMRVITDKDMIQRHQPLRLVSQISAFLHPGVSCFTQGCNLICSWCHNWDITFSSVGKPLTPKQFLETINKGGGNYSMIGISGGEPTLNRRWLIAFLKELRHGNNNLAIQVDTNGCTLTEEYIDELYDCGITHISPDIKAATVESFMSIAGVEDRQLAHFYLDRSWETVKHIVNEYTDKLCYVVAIPYHPRLNSLEEVYNIGKRLASLNRDIDVNLVEYHPAFRARKIPSASKDMVQRAVNVLYDSGLRNVWLQGSEDAPSPLAPEDLIDYSVLKGGKLMR